jgi:hypothetical protein
MLDVEDSDGSAWKRKWNNKKEIVVIDKNCWMREQVRALMEH